MSLSELFLNDVSRCKLLAFLRGINSNIDWIRECGRLMSNSDEKIIKHITAYGWYDKDLELIQYNKENDTINHYTKVINSNAYTEVGVMDFVDNNMVPDTVKNELKARLKILIPMLKIYGIKYVLTTDIDTLNRCKQIIPTCSLMYTQELLSTIDTTKIMYPTDDYYAIVENKIDVILCNFIHRCINNIDDNDTTIYKYNYIKRVV